MSYWISVKDKMPEKHVAVLAWFYSQPTNRPYNLADGSLRIVGHNPRPGAGWYDVRDGVSLINHVTHWQPLPGAPEEV